MKGKVTFLLLVLMSMTLVSSIVPSAQACFWRRRFRFYAVLSNTMAPALNYGDLIIVDTWVDPSEINAAPYPDGDIIVFYHPYDPTKIVVHRAVEKFFESGEWHFRTKADNNPGIDPWVVSEDLYIGLVVCCIPKLGFLFM